MSKTTIKLTYEDLLQYPEDMNRHELIDGEHYMTPAPGIRHQFVLKNIFRHLINWIESHDLGFLLSSPCDVYLTNTDVVQPDLIFIAKNRLPIFTPQYVHGAPELVVEILSPSTASRDLNLKKHLYEKYGVSEYWVVDPNQKTIDLFQLKEGRYSQPIRLTESDQLSSPLFPGLTISVPVIFAAPI